MLKNVTNAITTNVKFFFFNWKFFFVKIKKTTVYKNITMYINYRERLDKQDNADTY